jgi:23S rRNA (adenine2030-N6)-methyltransferase
VLAAQLLRASDHLTLLELHPQALAQLRGEFRGQRRVHIHASDSYAGLAGLLPPPERRGLVLIDPAYELHDEYRKVLRLLQAAHRRWPSGVYLIWYPLIRRPDAAAFPAAAAGAGIPKIWRCELDVLGAGHSGMRGSGLLVVNLPWGLEPVLAELLPWLWQALSDGAAGGWLTEWLVPEPAA